MLNPFGTKAKLLREVEGLCLFNDKGWGGDASSPEAIESERNKRLAKIQDLISRLNDSSLPQSFIAGVESGKICNELEGKYYESLKAYFKGSGNNAT
ncbi:hypothetical protein [Rheinheimera sp. MM224]|uniref:hypothetical protein n=1 Tax=Rheinheimera sp. MM224 TaxID=3019969 RepID=UPI0021F8A4BC|nr:hypothetical protein [Rheinheimera sp. MM224]CAI3798954.1 hypothetical protein JAMGFMIE_02204 [Rheinheimera sp. MM224]